jgi:hypothetical protein
MNTDVKPSEDNVNTQGLPTGSLSEDTTQDALEQAKQVATQVFGRLGDAPEYLLDIFREYKRPITVIGLVLGALIAVKLAFAVLGAINDIPVLAPTFELIGIGYTIWFVYRYLLKAGTRQELLANINSAKDQVIGKDA